MQFPIGAKALMATGTVAAGAVGAIALKNKLIKQSQVFGVPTEIAVGLGALLVGGFMGGDFGKAIALAGAGALGVGVVQLPQLASLTGASTPAIAGYAIGDLPSGGALYALPPGSAGVSGYQNLGQIAGLA